MNRMIEELVEGGVIKVKQLCWTPPSKLSDDSFSNWSQRTFRGILVLLSRRKRFGAWTRVDEWPYIVRPKSY
ncbi:MAG: hypothetical protein ACETWE_13565 [Candidatus Bathyarchaeia archaeon]